MRPLVSVVIPAFNAQAWLGECLASVRAQRGDFGLEILVVDDGSLDATATKAREEPDVRLLVLPTNRGPAAARNTGLAAATGEFVAFLDADDLWPQGSLAARLETLHRHPSAALAFGDCRQFNDSGPWPRTEFESGITPAPWRSGGLVPDAWAALLEDNFITTGSVLVRHQVLAKTGGFDEARRLVEDLDLWLRIARRHTLACCPALCLLRRRHAANSSRDAEAMALAYLEVLRRHTSDPTAAPPPRLGRVVAGEYLHLCRLALARGNAPLAAARAWRSFTTRPGTGALWQLGRAALQAVRGHGG